MTELHRKVKIINELGLHARAAAMVAKIAQRAAIVLDTILGAAKQHAAGG